MRTNTTQNVLLSKKAESNFVIDVHIWDVELK